MFVAFSLPVKSCLCENGVVEKVWRPPLTQVDWVHFMPLTLCIFTNDKCSEIVNGIKYEMQLNVRLNFLKQQNLPPDYMG